MEETGPLPVVAEQATAGSPRNSSLWRWRGPISLIGGSLFAALGLMFVSGALAHGGDDALETARPSELIQILDSLERENVRLEEEQRRLEAELESLTSGTTAQALAQARERRDALAILAGTTAVSGPGIRMVIRDPEGAVDAADILDAVQELRDAGAESIEVAQRRVVVDTWFGDPDEELRPAILVSGDVRPSPYVIIAVGDPQTMATAMEIPGGVADTMRTAGAEFTLDRRDDIEIRSTVPLTTPEYAQPVEAP